MDEKTMVNDVLDSCKLSLNLYENAIVKIKDMSLRQTIQQIRNNEESFQYEMFKIAQVKGYYIPTGEATVEEINEVKKELQ